MEEKVKLSVCRHNYPDCSFYTLIIGTSKQCYEIGITLNHHLVSQLPECIHHSTRLDGFFVVVDRGIKRIISMDDEEKTFLYTAFKEIDSLSSYRLKVGTAGVLEYLLKSLNEVFIRKVRETLDSAIKRDQRIEKARKRREDNFQRIKESIQRIGYYRTPHGYILPYFNKEDFSIYAGSIFIYFFAQNGLVYKLIARKSEFINKLYTLSRGHIPTKSIRAKPKDNKIKELEKIDQSLAVKVKLMNTE